MTQQIINTGSGPNAQDGDNLYVAFTKVNENFSNIWTQGPVDSNISIVNNAIISTDVNGNIVLMPNGIGYAQINATAIPGANNAYFLGDATRRWRGIYAGSAGINTTGNLYAGNLIISGNTVYTGDVTFDGNVGITNNLSAAGNITGDGNLLVTGDLTAGPATFGGNVAITGNLQVAGNIIYIDVEQLRVHDPVIEIGTGPNGTPLTSNDGYSRGLLMDYFNTTANTQQLGFMGLAGPNYTTYQFLTNATDVGNVFTGTPANLTFGNATASGLLSATGNIIGGNIVTVGNVSSTANVVGANLLTGGNISAEGGLIADTIYANTSIESGNTISAAGNITGAYLLGNGRFLSGIDTTLISNGTSRVQIVSADGNVIANVNGNTIATWTADGYSVTGNIDASGYYVGNGRYLTGVVADSIGNVISSLSVSGNIDTGNLNTAGNVTGNYILGNGSLLTGVITSVANINNGTSNVSIDVANANITMSVDGTANVVEVSTDGMSVNGTISTTGNVTVNGILTDNYYYSNGAPVDFEQPAGSNTWVQYNYDNSFGASAAFTFDSSANALVVSGNVTGGNLRTTGVVSATGNIVGGNLRTTGAVVGGTGSFLGDVSIYGNLQIGGNIVYVDVTELRVTDPVIEMGGGPNGTPLTADDGFSRGLKLDYFSDTANAAQFGFMGLAATDYTTYQFLTNATDTANTFTGTAANLYFGNASVTGNIATTGILTDNYYYANGQPIDMQQPAGSNTQIQFNDNNDFGASTAFTFDTDTTTLTVAGTANLGNVTIAGNSISAEGLLDLGSPSDITISGGSLNYLLSTDGTGNISWKSPSAVGVVGNVIDLGTPGQGNLISNAVTLTDTTSVTDGIALLNQVLGKLVPPAPPGFPGSSSLSISTATTTARMATGFTQPDNTPGANKAVAAGTAVAAIRGSSYTTNTIATTGPGDSGTLTLYLNGAGAGTATFNTNATPSANGTYSNLIVTNNYDYHTANASVAAGFWYVFSAQGSGAVPSGWNEIYIDHSTAGNTNTPYWYYDASTAAAPQFTSTSITPPGSPTLSYSSTIPHYTTGTAFNVGFNINRLSGNMYPNSDNLTSATAAGGAFNAPATVTYAAAGISTPLTQNLYVNSGSAAITTTAGIKSGFGSSATGPTITVTNSYNSTTNTFTPTSTILFKTGNATAIDEGNVVIGSTIGSGSGNAYRIENPGAGNTPTYTGSEATFNSQTSTLQTYDAVVVGSASAGVLKHDQTNYSTGYLPAGPNLSTGRSGTQYFTFKFVRQDVSKFDIRYTGNVAGMWVALPGSVIDSSSSANGWINMTTAYAGAGYPGVNSPGNGSDGCSLGGVVQVNTSVTNASKTCTFGTVSSSSTATNEIYIRIALTSGQTVTALTLQTASN